jgi:uncharacterized protein
VALVDERDMTAPPSPRTTVRRLPERARYDRDLVHSVLDEGLICHLGFVAADGGPVVIPTTYARDGEDVIVHGSPASRMLRLGRSGADVCLTVTLLDGMVLARSTFHHSMNYRSVVVFGRATEVTDLTEKARVLDLLVEHLVPGRTASARTASPKELRSTLVLRLPLSEASAKVRTGPPVDDAEDMGLPVWAGVLPVGLTPRTPVPDPDLTDGIDPPDHVTRWRRGPA